MGTRVISAPAFGCGSSSLFPYQQRVVEDFWTFLESAEDDPRPRARFGRIVLPPRTGKTIVAAQIIATTGLRALFVVPTRTLVEQTRTELAAWLGCPVGTYFGERKAVAEAGVNVTTYSLLQLEWHSGSPWPEAIRAAELVFPDEGHHVMTPERLAYTRTSAEPRSIGSAACVGCRSGRCRF